MVERNKTICPLDCPDACGMVATLEKGRVVKVEGDADHPFTKGFLCQKVRTFHKRIHSENRILHPQKRIGKKDEAQFVQISWDEAWQILTDKLKEVKSRYGPQALMPYSYAGNMGIINRMAGYSFFNRYGSSKLNMTICSAAASAAWTAHVGATPGCDPETATHSKLIVLWGINVRVTHIHFWTIINQARKNGAKLVVIDPYKNQTAKSADYYFQVKPGGDTAFALAVLKLLLKDDRINKAYINERTLGFESLIDYLEQTPLDDFIIDSGLQLGQLRELAQLLYENPRAFFRIGFGISRNHRGSMSIRAILSLAASLGLFTREKGKGVLLYSNAFKGNLETLQCGYLRKDEARTINMIQLGHALTALDPPVKMLFVYNSNPISVAPDSSTVKRGFMRDDLFVVVHDQFITPTASYADLILPATTSFENADLFTGYGHFYITKTAPVLPPQGESISNFDLFQSLGIKMGFPEKEFTQSIHERIENYLSDLKGVPAGFKSSQLEPQRYFRSEVLREDSFLFHNPENKFMFSIGNKIPCVPKSACLLDAREFDDINLRSRFPFSLITPPSNRILNSTFGERYIGEKGTVLIHPDDAESKDIKQGQTVRLFNHRGFCERTAVISDDTKRGLLVAIGVFWEDPKTGVQGINHLTSQNTTDLGDGPVFHESLVDIELA
ncbi:MAG: molybdopterin-dependent oxidoreductase [Deltaproteobacteria bacterium]|nr:molybdopterin-dependent oxidoreductase [Deltaproteobacteria bacterium]